MERCIREESWRKGASQCGGWVDGVFGGWELRNKGGDLEVWGRLGSVVTLKRMRSLIAEKGGLDARESWNV